MKVTKMIAQRRNAMRAIIMIIGYAALDLPDFRFHQLLWALDLVDDKDKFYEESVETLEKLLENPIVRSTISRHYDEINPLLNLVFQE